MHVPLSPFAARLEAAGAWPVGSRVLAACSGGPDSTALVLGLDELRRAGRLELVVAHVHHGLRGTEADAEADSVAELAARLGVAHLERRRDAALERTRRRRGLEEAARAIRRDALEEMRAESGCDVIALAHTLDDQAETILLRLVRGAGADGLSGMPERSGSFVRPLLWCRRDDLRRRLRAAGVAWSSDPSNWSPVSARALVRELLVRLEQSLNERIVERLAETAAVLRSESAALESILDERMGDSIARTRREQGAGTEVRVPVTALASLPLALARRAARRFLAAARPEGPPPSADAVRRVLLLAEPGTRSATAHVAGAVVRRSGGTLVAGPEPASRPPRGVVPLPLPGRVRWADGLIVAREARPDEAWEDQPEGGSIVAVDARATLGGLGVRTRRPGDVIESRGRSRRVSRLMAELGIPSGLRDRHPLVCRGDGGDTILWIAGHDLARHARPADRGAAAWVLEWSQD